MAKKAAVKEKENKNNGHKKISAGQPDNPLEPKPERDLYAELGVPPGTPTITPENYNPNFLVGASVDTGNPGSRILAMDRDLPTMLKALYIDDEQEAINFASALAWCIRWNHKDKKGNGSLDAHIEALKYRLALKCSRKAFYTHLYGEFANGLITTDANGRGLQHIISKNKDDGKDGKDNNKPRF